MEISYYYECYNFKANFDPKCLKIDVLTAEFSFWLPLHDDFNDILSSKSKTLLKIIEPLLKQSFGAMEINLSSLETKIEKGSVIIVEELRPVRNSVPEVKLLLSNNKTSCEKFLDETNCLCWHENAQKIFQEKGFLFLGVKLIESNVQEVPITAFRTTSKTVLPTSRAIKTEESISSGKSPKFFARPIRSTQRFTMTTTSITKQAISTAKKNDFQSISAIIPTRMSSTKLNQLDCQEIIGPKYDQDTPTCSISTSFVMPNSSCFKNSDPDKNKGYN